MRHLRLSQSAQFAPLPFFWCCAAEDFVDLHAASFTVLAERHALHILAMMAVRLQNLMHTTAG